MSKNNSLIESKWLFKASKKFIKIQDMLSIKYMPNINIPLRYNFFKYIEYDRYNWNDAKITKNFSTASF